MLKKLFNKKQTPQGDEQQLSNHQIISAWMSMVTNDELAIPRYCPDIRTETDAKQYATRLPLVYVWNEDAKKNSFTVSINGHLVAYLLESFCKRDDPAFVTIRDEIMTAFAKSASKITSKICAENGLLPSQTFEWYVLKTP